MAPLGVSLASTDGLISEGVLATNQTIVFYIQFNNTFFIVDGITNGFRVYSPDGAQWTSLTAEYIHPDWPEMFDFKNLIDYYGVSGSGADTVGFTSLNGWGTGMPSFFFDQVLAITIGPIGDQYSDLTICLDSSFYGESGTWSWGERGGIKVFPQWDGPHCFVVGRNEISVSGYVYFLDPLPPDTIQVPACSIRVELWDDDVSSPDDLLGETYSDYSGYYEFVGIDNDDVAGGLDIYLKCVAETDACYVTSTTDAGDVCVYKTAVMDNVPAGSYTIDPAISLDSSGPFAICDAIGEARSIWQQHAPSGTPAPEPIHVVLSAENPARTYYNGQYIHIDSSTSDALFFPDTFDRYAIHHEYGHFLEDIFSFFDDGPGGYHLWDFPEGCEIAASEGFAHFWAGLVDNDSILVNYDGSFQHFYWKSLENGEWGFDSPDSAAGSANNIGDACEGAVAGMLWDIYDAADDDYSSWHVWPDTPMPVPDGIGDALSDGPDNILIALVDRHVNGHRPDTYKEFYRAWFEGQFLGNYFDLRTISYEHGEDSRCCINITGNANGDPADWVGISDLTFLVDFLFGGGSTPPCVEEGNVDNSRNGYIDISDVIYISDYMFHGGPLPPPCDLNMP
jgi:hypothetical protein